MYEIILSDRAKRQLNKLDPLTRRRIGAVIERIRIRPFAHVKVVIGESCYRARAGDYRILLEIHKGKLIILVLEIGHRRNIYK
jgi:mRNA interferase RelE/StbE